MVEARVPVLFSLIDPDANAITLNGYGKGIIDAR